MTDLTQRIINALRRAVISARNADEAKEAEFLADSIEEMGAAYSKLTVIPPAAPVVEMTAEPPPQPPVSNEFVAPGAEPFAHLPLTPEQRQAAAPPAPAVEQKS